MKRKKIDNKGKQQLPRKPLPKRIDMEILDEKLSQAGFGARIHKLSYDQKIKLLDRIGAVIDK